MLKRFFLAGLAIIIIIFAFMTFFNRAPHRQVPDGRVVISPANGRLVAIKKIDGQEVSFIKGDILNKLEINELPPPFWAMIIEMNVKNVHVQRAPISGAVVDQEYFPGQFKNVLAAKNKEELVNLNEKMLTIISGEEFKVGVIQVAGQLARRIKSAVSIGQQLSAGEIFGRITLGSQVILLIPGALKLKVSEGQKVIDGETVMAEY